MNLRTYVRLETALTQRLQKAWREKSAPFYAEIARLCREGKWDAAREVVSELDLTDVGTENREFIKFALSAQANWGASMVYRGTPSFVGESSFEHLLRQVTGNVLQYLTHSATAQVQEETLQLIAEDQAAASVQKGDFKYGSTQVDIPARSSASKSLDELRGQIADEDLDAYGKEVEGNHVTVRYGISSDDVDGLEAYIQTLSPFEVQLGAVEAFKPGKHSKGATPLVVQVHSPDLHFIHHEIEKYGDFIEPTFPEYKPHATLAYVKPEAADKYLSLQPSGSFIVDSITISHRDGTAQRVDFKAQKFNDQHEPAGSPKGGQFAPKNYVQEGARGYVKEQGLPEMAPRKYVKPDIRAPQIADYFEKQVHNPTDPAVVKAYGALGKEIQQQWDYATQKMGVKFEAWTKPGQPYANSDEMRKDVLTNKHLYFFTGGNMQEDHPLSKRDASGLSLNDKFRAVHDLFGHAMEGNQFGPRGEENAWVEHSKMFTEDALPALTAETKAQNSWVNFSSAIRAAELSGHPIPLAQRPFADQKAIAIPDKYVHREVADAELFGSPNTEHLTFEEAVRRMQGDQASKYIDAARSIDQQLGVSADYERGLGLWGGNPEPTVLEHIKNKVDPDTLEAAAAMVGKFHNQEATLSWFNDEDGPHARHIFTVPATKIEDAPKLLEKAGLEGATVIPHGDGLRIELISTEPKSVDVHDIANKLGATEGEEYNGYARFIERKDYDKIITDYQKNYVQKHDQRRASGYDNALEWTYPYQRQSQSSSQKADKEGRYVTPFVSFAGKGEDKLQLIASLNSSRLATWGFTAEAEVRGLQRYRLTAVLDGRTSKFCRQINGRIFDVPDARKKVVEVLNVQDPEDLKNVQPWPAQTKDALAQFQSMSNDELVAAGLHIPPFHPYCRTVCTAIGGDTEINLQKPEVAPEAQILTPQTATQDTFKEMGQDLSQEQLDQWNDFVGLSPLDIVERFEHKEKGKVTENLLDLLHGALSGNGGNEVDVDPDGDIAMSFEGILDSGNYATSTVLDPYTGTYYLSEASLINGSPETEVKYLRNLFSSMIDVGQSMGAEAVTVNVGEAAYLYTRLGFLPSSESWTSIREDAWESLKSGDLQEVFDDLEVWQQLLLQQLLGNTDEDTLSVIVALPWQIDGKSIGEWILEGITGDFSLDLTNKQTVAQAKELLA